MEKSRRVFLRNSAMALAGTVLLPEIACSGNAGKRVVALQLYSVRDEMRNDPLGTLTQLAEMGYTHVEHANYVNHKFYGWTAKEFKKVLDDLGLIMPSGHTVLSSSHWDTTQNAFTPEWNKLVEDAAYMGQEYVVSPWLEDGMRRSYDKFMGFLEVFNKCGELCKKSGMRFGYHNHDFEFSESLNGEKLFDLIMKNTDADKVVMQLDMGNMYIAGALAKDVLSQYPGRYDNIHVKDMIQAAGGEGFESTIIGQGVVNTREVTDLARKMGARLFVIEQESYQGKSPLSCMKDNLDVIKEWGY
ncbi:MAG: sugar phosphate isomerase/epimerase family protein [Mariniphaga sp.]|nr:sugar phosphate isomerase/epimerase [Mariniphaga sp.]MDD4227164.1 sugar phosphate isomerase/epimerase [Mariniphaga sp.]MDD4425933.1 sugar phosphate isomerase/epimerase [Mariniphaga sp.]